MVSILKSLFENDEEEYKKIRTEQLFYKLNIGKIKEGAKLIVYGYNYTIGKDYLGFYVKISDRAGNVYKIWEKGTPEKKFYGDTYDIKEYFYHKSKLDKNYNYTPEKSWYELVKMNKYKVKEHNLFVRIKRKYINKEIKKELNKLSNTNEKRMKAKGVLVKNPKSPESYDWGLNAIKIKTI
ncbi:MAG: hypothetical protein ACOCP8_02600 [archaeon]